MSQKYSIELEALTKDAVKKVGELNTKVDDLTKGQAAAGKETKKTNKILGGLKTLVTGGLGLGILIKLFDMLKETFMSNQKVVDSFAIGMEALSIAFNDLFKFLDSNVGNVIEYFKAIFNDPQQALKDLGVAIKKNIIERLNSAIEVFGYLGTAIKKVFQGDWEGAMEAAKNAGEEYVDVLTGVDGSLDKIKETVSNATDAVVSYATATIKSATAIVELNKQAELAAVINQGLIEKYDRQAEQQRQIRDEERNTIKDRIEANNKLNEILDEQEKLMLSGVDLIIKSAQAQYDKNKSQENLLALTEAQNEKLGVQAQISGFRSEQKSNDLALDRESIELTQSKTDAEAELNIAALQFNADLIIGEYAKLLALKDVAEQEYQIDLKRLQDKKALYKEGTLAFQEAQNEIDVLTQENSQNEVELDKQTTAAKIDLASNAMGDLASIFGEESKAGKAAAIAQTTIETYKGATSAFASLSGIPVVGPVLGGIAAAAAVAAGFANVKKIASIGPSVGGGSPSQPSVPRSPSFNVVGAAPENQLAQAIGNKEDKPLKAFVVSNEITNQQALDRNITEGASIG
tara:strand:- start:4210 stop:5934 length:1725 start_codon:yes stop_codon:yes gene_type:complete